MYSNNDYRDYLEHSKKWTWPNGNNSPEYNSWYYNNHKDQWKTYYNNAKKKVKDVTGLTAREQYISAKNDADSYRKALNYVHKQRADISDDIHKKEKLKRRANAQGRELLDWQNRNQRATVGYYDDILYGNSKNRVPYTSTKRASETANAAAAAKRKYEKTPLGRVESAYKKGKKIVNAILSRFKR